MRAVQLCSPKKLELINIAAPEANGHNVVIKVLACGICGSDLHYWEAGIGLDGRPGLIMGHEFCGLVQDAGIRKDLAPGDRVTALPINPCGTCPSCRNGLSNLCMEAMKREIPGNNSPGAFAEYVSIRPDMVRKLPDSVSDKEGALVEPAAVALHAVRQSGLGPGDRVLITGGGPIGLLCAAWARTGGASRVALTEVDHFRRAFAMETGDVDEAFDAGATELHKMLKKYSKGGFDTAIETSASDAGIHAAMSALRPRGRLVLAGINFNNQQVPTLLYAVKELDQVGSFAYLPEEFDMCIQYLAEEKLNIKKMITQEIRFEKTQEVFEEMAQRTGGHIKIILRP
jgi:threonine dehydrogenase-like Zn-dependent dehydrogenase